MMRTAVLAAFLLLSSGTFALAQGAAGNSAGGTAAGSTSTGGTSSAGMQGTTGTSVNGTIDSSQGHTYSSTPTRSDQNKSSGQPSAGGSSGAQSK